MTLGSWFREYLYFPLGGSKKGTKRTVFNLFVVWCATGFWHGAEWNYLLWGFYLFTFMVLEKYFIMDFLERHHLLSLIYIIIVLQLNWIIFGVNDLREIIILIWRTFSFTGGVDWIYALCNYGAVFLVGTIFLTPLVKPHFQKFEKEHKYACALIYLVLTVLSVA